MSERRLLAGWLGAAGSLLVGLSADAALLRYEYSAAHQQLARVKMLTERLSKENLLRQLQLAPDASIDLVEITEAIDESLELLRDGKALRGVPRPPTQKIRDQLVKLEEAWGPLRANALTSPYRTPSRAFGLGGSQGRASETVLRHFDHVAARVAEAADRVAQLYLAACKADGYSRCDLDTQAGNAHLLSEQIMEDAIFVFTGIDRDAARERLVSRIEAFHHSVHPPPETRRFLDEAMSVDRGSEGEYVRNLQNGIEENWPRLRREVTLVAEGSAERANLLAAVQLQRRIVADLERLTVAMVRFTFIEEGGEGLSREQ